MQKPKISDDNKIIVEQRKASKEITSGIENEIDALHILSTSKRLKEFIFFIFLYTIGATLIILFKDITTLIIIGILLMGIALNSLGIFIHEGLHGLLAKNPKINHLLSFLVGVPIMFSSTAYQVTHTNHHFELGRKLDYGTYKQHVKSSLFVWAAYFAQLTFGMVIYLLCIPFLAFKSASFKSRLFILLEYSIIVTIFFIFFTYTPTEIILFFWFYPILVLSILSNIRGIASHALGDVENIYLSSRTIKSSKWVSIIFLYENYHLEHHIFPQVPSYNLSKLHSLIWHRLPQAVYSKSYLQFLITFFKAAIKNDLKPAGVVDPKNEVF